jgi:hypothetical protein
MNEKIPILKNPLKTYNILETNFSLNGNIP